MSNIPAQADETAENSADISREIKFAAAKKSTWVSVWVNTLLSAWQIVAGIFSHSQGLIADGVHTLSDLIADFVVLIANRGSRKAPDEEHPYGHFRYENVASLVLGVLLLVVSGGMLWTAGSRIM
ncbi:MAG: cation diffusion facilitator family transporter, partial [Morganella morganii]|nr:cation diffusion facilitator family transporter [Morganella morganii]